MATYRCYECECETNYLFGDGRCSKCTRLSVKQVTGGDNSYNSYNFYDIDDLELTADNDGTTND